MPLPLAEFVAGEVPETVVRGVLVHLGKRRIVEDEVDEEIDRAAGFEHHHSEVNQSGVVFFPGSEPLYINGNLVGGLGVSGDGVDQDDYVTAGGAAGFEPSAAIRADQITIGGVRLPYLKFPRNPTQ